MFFPKLRHFCLLFCLFPATSVASAQLETFSVEANSWPDTGLSAIRGVTIGPIESSQHPNRGYGSSASAELLDELKRMGVNWVAITPYGRMWNDRSTEIRMDFEAPYEQNRQAMKDIVAQAHARNIRVMLVPHIWMEAGGERRSIDPGSEARWKQFLESYRRFIVAWAKDAGDWGVDMYAIGQECQTFSGRYGHYWKTLIAQVRDVFPGLLTYSANWYQETIDVLFGIYLM
ncbi:MAG: hypothetical protein IPJ88_09280 [Myxococcales bacterium]|nr:MAG: hypothetical protein IPJ88_09280 [Myxococcales bacterium]